MANLVGAIEDEFVTDFALLFAEQEGVNPGGAFTHTFAGSGIGTLGMCTGSKYSAIRVRVERWDSRPEWVGDDWEDCDELPWVSESDGGRLYARGFDPPTGEGLEVEDMGTSRVQVFARGRHQYSIDEPENPDPEYWLIRLWPEPGPVDPLAGPPRRTAGPGYFGRAQRSPWEAALYGWEVSDWSRRLRDLDAIRDIHEAIRRVGHPFERDELLADLEPSNWSTPVDYKMPPAPNSPVDRLRVASVTNLLGATGLSEAATFGDVFTCLTRLGFLAECNTSSGKRWVPNPSPERIPEEFESSAWIIRSREVRRFHHIEIKYLEGDIENLIRWAGDGLVTSPRKVAIRLSVPPEDVIDAIRFLAIQRPGAVDVNPLEIGADTTVTLKDASWARLP